MTRTLKTEAKRMENFPVQDFLESQFPIIGKDEIERIALKIRSRSVTNPAIEHNAKNIRSNTTVLAIKYTGGAVIAGDRRTSEGWFSIYSDETVKVEQLSQYSALACAGNCNVIESLKINTKAICKIFKERYCKELSPDGQANFLSTMLERWYLFFLYTWSWTIAFPILAAYDVQQKKPRIFCYDETGFKIEPALYTGTGCGYENIRGLLNDRCQKKMKAEEAIELAVRALFHSGSLSSGVSDARISPPTIATVSKFGFKWVSQKKISKIVENISKERG